jgi:lysophospholipid acyltransferase (LPLAT)-like uncharacterized protein
LPNDHPATTGEDARATTSLPEAEPRGFTRWQRIQIWLISTIASLAIHLIGPTLRFTISYEEGAPEPWDEQRAIFVFWHRCVFPACWRFRNHQIAVMTSQSYDGEYIARTIEHFGFRAVRGSSSRGGAIALRGMQRELEEGRAVAFTIDGPRGPKYVAKFGPVALSRNTQRPILAFYVALDRPWTLNSWDEFMIPKPFSRAHARVSRPITVPAEADPEAMKRYHAEMQAALERVTADAEAAVASTT